MSDCSQYFKSSFKDKIAYKANLLGSDTTIFFLGGYASSMIGTKASALHTWTLKKNINFIRFDYSGHGVSSGKFKDGSISKWSTEAFEVFDKFKSKKNILIGSSMGGWISLLIAEKYQNNVHGLLGIASAPDFTVEEWKKLSSEEKIDFKAKGSILFPDPDYGDYEVFYEFVNDGFKHLLLNRKIDVRCPVRLLHGRLDRVVPFSTSEKIIEQVLCSEKNLIMIDDGDHSLSRDQDLEILYKQIEYFI